MWVYDIRISHNVFVMIQDVLKPLVFGPQICFGAFRSPKEYLLAGIEG